MLNQLRNTRFITLLAFMQEPGDNISLRGCYWFARVRPVIETRDYRSVNKNKRSDCFHT